ncbi:MAG: hypothetical protein M9904_13525 [Chitinophagaceae bacterium]|nr:hypothetical protein [Chitinophagaceae bacterium]
MLADISTWWQSIVLFEQIFWVIALLFSLLFLIQTLLSFAAGDADTAVGDSDSYIDHDEGIGYQFFTIKNLIAFFTMFGWTGIACIRGGLGAPATVLFAVLAGAVVVAIMIMLLRVMGRLKQSGTMDIMEAVNKTGTVYLFIPAVRGGTGKVHVQVQGAVRELPAITDEAKDIPTGSIVTITGVINESVLLVRPAIV